MVMKRIQYIPNEALQRDLTTHAMKAEGVISVSQAP